MYFILDVNYKKRTFRISLGQEKNVSVSWQSGVEKGEHMNWTEMPKSAEDGYAWLTALSGMVHDNK